MATQPLQKPPLSLLVWVPPDNSTYTIKMPQTTLAKWYAHEQYGEEFKAMYHKLEAEFGDLTAGKTTTPKRGAGAPAPSPSPQKKPKVDIQLVIVDNGAMMGELLAECDMMTLRGSAKLVFHTAGHVYITNTGDADLEILENTELAGFSPKNAKFDKGDVTEKKKDFSLPYVLPDADAYVKVEGEGIKTLYETIEAKRASKPDQAKVCFHAMTDTPTEDRPGYFTLQHLTDVTKRIFFLIPQKVNITTKKDTDKKDAIEFSQKTADQRDCKQWCCLCFGPCAPCTPPCPTRRGPEATSFHRGWGMVGPSWGSSLGGLASPGKPRCFVGASDDDDGANDDADDDNDDDDDGANDDADDDNGITDADDHYVECVVADVFGRLSAFSELWGGGGGGGGGGASSSRHTWIHLERVWRRGA